VGLSSRIELFGFFCNPDLLKSRAKRGIPIAAISGCFSKIPNEVRDRYGWDIRLPSKIPNEVRDRYGCDNLSVLKSERSEDGYRRDILEVVVRLPGKYLNTVAIPRCARDFKNKANKNK
jgi:bifunctional DNA-binding transcriptional regulator/antitoxin component of YhaV-PrlF toxin-antitoxin module